MSNTNFTPAQIEILLNYRKAVVENKKTYIKTGSRQAVQAANVMLRDLDAKLGIHSPIWGL
jgi:hypothetical protein